MITQAGTGALNKTNGGNLFINLDGSTYAGSAININGGGFNLAPAATPIIANINLAAASTVTTILRTGLSGEGQTTGTLSFAAAGAFGTNTSANANILTFNGNTTGPTDHLRVGDVNMNAAARVEVKLAGTTAPATGLVVFDSASGILEQLVVHRPPVTSSKVAVRWLKMEINFNSTTTDRAQSLGEETMVSIRRVGIKRLRQHGD